MGEEWMALTGDRLPKYRLGMSQLVAVTSSRDGCATREQCYTAACVHAIPHSLIGGSPVQPPGPVLRPDGAQECSHGWSVALALPADAQPVVLARTEIQGAPAGRRCLGRAVRLTSAAFRLPFRGGGARRMRRPTGCTLSA